MTVNKQERSYKIWIYGGRGAGQIWEYFANFPPKPLPSPAPALPLLSLYPLLDVYINMHSSLHYNLLKLFESIILFYIYVLLVRNTNSTVLQEILHPSSFTVFYSYPDSKIELWSHASLKWFFPLGVKKILTRTQT